MGVRALLNLAAGRESALAARLDAVGGRRTDERWHTQCVFHRPRVADDAGLADLYRVTFSEAQQHYLYTKRVLLEAGPEIAAVHDAMQTHVPRVNAHAEGFSIRCGDMTVRLGALYLNNSVAGTVVEVEYLPCTLASAGGAALAEFVEWLLAEGSPPTFRSGDDCFSSVASLPAQFGCHHRTMQFVHMLQEAHKLFGSA
jgi:hypothetical protein